MAECPMYTECVGEDELVRFLRDSDLRDLGELFHSCPSASTARDLRDLRQRLGVRGEPPRAGVDSNPFHALVGMWARQEGSTVGVLRDVLKDVLRRDDCVTLLDRLRYRYVTIRVRVFRFGRATVTLEESTDVPGRRRLIDHARPLLRKHVELELTQAGRPLLFKMEQLGTRRWDSYVEEFERRPASDPATPTDRADGLKRYGHHDKVQPRNAQTAYLEGLMSFDFVDLDPGKPAAALLEQGIGGVGAGDQPLPPQPAPLRAARTNSVVDLEREMMRRLEGFFVNESIPEDGRRDEATKLLAQYASPRQNGHYMIRPRLNGQTYTLSVTYEGMVHHITLEHNAQTGDYWFYRKARKAPSFKSASVEDLVVYFRSHDMDDMPRLRLSHPYIPPPAPHTP